MLRIWLKSDFNFYDMIYDMILYDMILYDMIWYDMIWYINHNDKESLKKLLYK